MPPMSHEPIKLMWPLDHYFSPVPNTRKLARRRFRKLVWPDEPHPTPGIDWRDEAQIELCGAIARQEPMAFPQEASGEPSEYFKDNDLYSPLDAWVLQALLRHFEPSRVVEIGAGYSTLVTARVNRDFHGSSMRFTSIDPYPAPFVAAGVPGLSELRAEDVLETPLELFEALAAGDVLFIDTSHTVKTGGEVPWIYNQILPRLKAGVLVHLHDVFLPGDYPPEWVLQGRAWNELYLAQSFLVFNNGYELVFGVQWMLQHHRDLVDEAFPEVAGENGLLGSSLWIRRV
jgi:predicted O-methyltransferase YrrM